MAFNARFSTSALNFEIQSLQDINLLSTLNYICLNSACLEGERVKKRKRKKNFNVVFWAEHMFHLNHELVNKSIWIYTLVQGDIYANNFPLYTCL